MPKLRSGPNWRPTQQPRRLAAQNVAQGGVVEVLSCGSTQT